MDENAQTELIGRVLVSLGRVLDEVKRSLFARDGRRLTQAEKTFEADLMSRLPLFEEAGAKKERGQALRRLGTAAEELLRRMRTGLEADISFTDKAACEMSEVVALVRDAARDTNDMLAASSPGFRQYVLSGTGHIAERVQEYTAGNEQRLTAGRRPPAASALYLDIMRSLKGIAGGLASIAQDA